MIVGELRDNDACLACHATADLEAGHSHPLEPIKHCERCHALHGSARKGLLKAPAKQLWDEYHKSLGTAGK
jgi:predicted CXXCH cytochrome family protein